MPKHTEEERKKKKEVEKPLSGAELEFEQRFGRPFRDVSAQEIIGAQEKAKARLGKRKVSLEEAGAQISPKVDVEGLLQKQAMQAMEQKKIEELLPKVEEAGVLEEPPKKQELDIPKQPGGGIPFIGAPIVAIGNALSLYLKGTPLKSFAGDIKGLEPLIQNPEGQREIMMALIQNPEGQREIMMAEIEAEHLDRAISANEAIGATAEALGLTNLPFEIGTMVEKFTKTPSEDVETLREDLKTLEGRASGMTDAIAQGEIGSPTEALNKLIDMDMELVEIQSDLRFAFSISAELQADPKEVDLIEKEILKVRETIFEAKQRGAEGALITPSTEHLFTRLMNLKNET